MNRHFAHRSAGSLAAADVLIEVYRRIGAIHATLAEADKIDEGLHRRTIDRLMDILEFIEETPKPDSTSAR